MKQRASFARRFAAVMAVVAIVLAAVPAPAYADASRVVTIGADLTAEQRANVLKFFGLTEGDLSNLTVVNVTNADERAHLSGSIDLGVIGNRTYSCSYIQPTNSGGIYVQTANLNYVTNYMLYNALQTAGVKNCNLVVTAPFVVSGTGALTGVFMAYEAQGQKLDDTKQKVATEELVTTAELGETYGNSEGVAEVISQVKDEVVSSPQTLSDDEIRQIVSTEAQTKGIAISDADLDRIMQLVSRLQGLDYDVSAFQTTLDDFESKLDEVAQKAQQVGEQVSEQSSGFLDAVAKFFKRIADWFMGLFNGGQKPEAETATGSATNTTSGDVSESAQDFFNNFNTDVFQWDSAQDEDQDASQGQGAVQDEGQSASQGAEQGAIQGEDQSVAQDEGQGTEQGDGQGAVQGSDQAV